MECPACRGYIIWEPKNPPFPAHHRCMKCRRPFSKEEIRAIRKAEKSANPQKEGEMMTEKTEEKKKECTGPCGKEYPATTEYFHKNSSAKDGLDYMCRTCKSKRAKNYYKESKTNPSKRKERHEKPRDNGKSRTSSRITKATPDEIVAALRKGVAMEIIKELKEMVRRIEERWA